VIRIRLDSEVSLARQIERGLRSAIAQGALKPGDELPPVRQLAADLGVNLNTVARSYRALESDGLVQSVRGRGTRVTAAREKTGESRGEAVARVRKELRETLADARLAGLGRAAVVGLARRELARFWPRARPARPARR